MDARFKNQWRCIKARTSNPKNPDFKRYGGRGIRMAAIFRESAQALWDELGPPPAPGLTIDRINPNKGYVPGNLRWADRFTQNNNHRDSVKYDFNGKELTMSELARELGLPYFCLNKRIKILGWSLERAIKRKKGRYQSWPKSKPVLKAA